MVFGATTQRMFADMLAKSTEGSEVRDPWVTRMWRMPATVVSTTLEEPLDWPNANVVRGDAVDVVARLKEESDVPLRSHGSLSMNRALMAAGLVDLLQVTLFPVITGQTGLDPIFEGAADFDLELLEHRTLDGSTRSSSTDPASIDLARIGSGPGELRKTLGRDGAGHFASTPSGRSSTSPARPGVPRGLDRGARAGRAGVSARSSA